MTYCRLLAALTCGALVWCTTAVAQDPENEGFVSLFNGKDFTGWKVPAGDNGHWRVVDGVIDYDAASESPEKDKCLWTDKSYGDFILKIEWRLKPPSEVPQRLTDAPIILPDGTTLRDALGKEIKVPRACPDSGVYLRGTPRAQLNMWGWPVGSGEVYGYRNGQSDPEVRAGVTPLINADKPLGEWNQFEIYMIQDRLTVLLNSQTVLANALLPKIPVTGPIALQHHGGLGKDGIYNPSSSLVQFRNIWIRELPSPEQKTE